jgi:hypothetical protein
MNLVVKKTFRAVQKHSDARRAKTEPRGVYEHTLSGAVCSATPHMGVFHTALTACRKPALPSAA